MYRAGYDPCTDHMPEANGLASRQVEVCAEFIGGKTLERCAPLARKTTTTPYPPAARGRALQRGIDALDRDASLTAAVRAISGRPGCPPDRLRVRYRRARRDAGKEAGSTQVAKPACAR